MTSLSQESAIKHQIEKQSGEVPLPRFGHTCCFVGGTFVVLFGGATGDGGRYTINNDTYLVDVSSNTWKKLVSPEDSPSPRAAHCVCCVDHMQMVVYGGATGGGSLSQDVLYLLDLRTFQQDGKFNWATVPVEGPTPGRRYGHSMVYSKPLLIVFGGNNGQEALNEIWTLDVEKNPFRWTKVTTDKLAPPARVYHSAQLCTKGPASGMTVIFGGRTGDNKSLKDAWGLRQHRDGRWDWVEAPAKRGNPPEPRYQHCCLFFQTKLIIVGGRGNEAGKQLPTSVYDTETCEWKDYFPGTNRFRHSSWLIGPLMFTYGGFDHQAPSVPTNDWQVCNITAFVSDVSALPTPTMSSMPTPTMSALPTMNSSVPTSFQSVRLAAEVYVASDTSVRRVALGSLEDESRKVGAGVNVTMEPTADPLVSKILATLLTLQVPNAGNFFLSVSEISRLIQLSLPIIQAQPMLLRLRSPIKVYGDLHGQFPDLMRMFSKFGSPQNSAPGGDIDSVDYLFLGDYVDRGSYSLEIMVLLLALKVQYPLQVHLLRGNHEDATINALYGFKDECTRRLKENSDYPNSVWMQFNLLFEYLPCGALIDGKMLCIHGGIGGSISTIADIENLKRPLKVSQTPSNFLEQKVTDLLWSDPTDNDAEMGVTMNETRDPDGSGRITKFGPDRVTQFLASNPPLQLIIRAHECVMDGFERFAGGKLITVFSATDYCGHHKNAGALLFVKRDLTILPKLIYPEDRASHWDNRITLLRPPTPPRDRLDNGPYPLHPANNEQRVLAAAHAKNKILAD